jgi:ribonuclease VapC
MRAVLDASALIAFIDLESGGDVVAGYIGDSIISAVNYSEVVAKFVSRGAPASRVEVAVRSVGLDVVDFDRFLATSAAALIAKTTVKGLSLGDRACLALAAREALPALTCDRVWNELKLGIDVRLIR